MGRERERATKIGIRFFGLFIRPFLRNWSIQSHTWYKSFWRSNTFPLSLAYMRCCCCCCCHYCCCRLVCQSINYVKKATILICMACIRFVRRKSLLLFFSVSKKKSWRKEEKLLSHYINEWNGWKMATENHVHHSHLHVNTRLFSWMYTTKRTVEKWK